jgi:membrane protein
LSAPFSGVRKRPSKQVTRFLFFWGYKRFYFKKINFSKKEKTMPLTQTNNAPKDFGKGDDHTVAPDDKVGRIQKWAFRLKRGENKLVGTLRSWFRVFFIMTHEFSETAITLRASALTYSIVLSMVPILAMSTAVLKGLGSDNQLKTAAYRLIDQLEPENPQEQTLSERPLFPEESATQEEAASPAGDEEKETVDTSAKQSLTSHLRNAVDTIFNYVDRTNFAAIGAFGIVGLLLAVIIVLSTIENAMNEIWHTKQGRSLFRKVMDYLALLILLPISINVALAGDAVLESSRIMSYLHTFIPSPWAVKMLLKLLPFLFVVLTLTLMYQFFPNVRVKTHAAFAGALFAGFFWFAVQRA